MSSAQRSEGVNFFFKGYMSLSSDLKQFINLFEMALARKIEEEKIMNANTKERPFKCNEVTLVEEVFHKAYTNSKFKEVQEEVHGLMHTNENKVSEDGSLKVYEVAEKIVKPIWKVKRKKLYCHPK